MAGVGVSDNSRSRVRVTADLLAIVCLLGAILAALFGRGSIVTILAIVGAYYLGVAR